MMRAGVRFALDVLLGVVVYRRGWKDGERFGQSVGRIRGAVELAEAQQEARSVVRPPRAPRFPWGRSR